MYEVAVANIHPYVTHFASVRRSGEENKVSRSQIGDFHILAEYLLLTAAPGQFDSSHIAVYTHYHSRAICATPCFAGILVFCTEPFASFFYKLFGVLVAAHVIAFAVIYCRFAAIGHSAYSLLMAAAGGHKQC